MKQKQGIPTAPTVRGVRVRHVSATLLCGRLLIAVCTDAFGAIVYQAPQDCCYSCVHYRRNVDVQVNGAVNQMKYYRAHAPDLPHYWAVKVNDNHGEAKDALHGTDATTALPIRKNSDSPMIPLRGEMPKCKSSW